MGIISTCPTRKTLSCRYDLYIMNEDEVDSDEMHFTWSDFEIGIKWCALRLFQLLWQEDREIIPTNQGGIEQTYYEKNIVKLATILHAINHWMNEGINAMEN